MELLIDLGNTRAKYQLLSATSKKTITALNYCEFTQEYFEQHWSNVNHIFISAVANISQVNKVEKWADEQGVLFTHITTEKKAFGITAGYFNHEQLGVDRWLALIGASILYPHQNILIIDAGTATTIDYLNAQGQHYGGWILPGFEMMKNSLLSNTANINIEPINNVEISPGKSTSENVYNGCWLALSGSINQALIEIEKKNEVIDVVLLTGGNSEQLKNLIGKPVMAIDSLIFTGIEQYAKQK